MKKLLTLFMLTGFVFWLASCSDDDETPTVVDLDEPVVTTPAPTTVQVGGVTTIDFSITAAAGFASATATATGGNASITAEPEAGATSGTVTVDFTANAEAGAGSVTLTVTDSEGDSESTTAVLTVSPSAVPSISGIPASASVEAGETLGPVTATVEMADVPGTLTITRNGEAFGDPIDITTDGETVDFTYPTDVEEAGSTIEFGFTAEDADGDTDVATHVLSVTIPNVNTIVVTDNVAADVTWETGNIYELAGRITVLPGATLTIEPGVVVKGQPGTGANSSTLLVARGGVLNALGEADRPIIMTSTSDQIIPGQINSPNLDATINGLWGGLIVLGSAPISASNDVGDVTEVQIEGIPSSDVNGLYGGNDETDNSGTITYVSVRHGGTLIGSGNEINGITLGGVGSGTTIENVEVVGNQDDGIEWFGGNVNVTNALIWNSGDDSMDTDQDWIGTCDNFIIVTPKGGSAFELDGPEGTTNRGVHTFINGTVYAGEEIDHLVDWDGSTNAELIDIYFYGWSASYGAETDFDPIESFNGDDAGASANWQYTLPEGGRPVDEVFTGVPAEALTAVAANANTVGADASVFNWTWASVSGALASIGIE